MIILGVCWGGGGGIEGQKDNYALYDTLQAYLTAP